jgi:hypothetical protein
LNSSDIDDLIKEWHQWRNLDHRIINDGVPTGLDAAVNLYVMEEEIEKLINDIKIATLSNNDYKNDCDKLQELIKDYQEKIYVTILSK